MPEIELKKYTPTHPALKKLIKFYWLIHSSKEVNVHGRLIPTNNIDLILNFSRPIQYTNKAQEHKFPAAHFSGIQSNYRIMAQEGPLDVVGISFHSTGFFPLIKVPLYKFASDVFSMEDISPGFEKQVERIGETASIPQRIAILEETLLNRIDLNLLPGKSLDLVMDDFLRYADDINIHDYCKAHGINQKTLERFFNKYIGTTPKAFLLRTKFQRAMKGLMVGDFDSLTQLGYSFNYYDQTHFINSFKSFSGKTPARQLKDNDLIFDLLKNL